MLLKEKENFSCISQLLFCIAESGCIVYVLDSITSLLENTNSNTAILLLFNC
ncbi:hypothetical protein N499_1054 [Wolbachia pipientis wVitA]|nr:hypothetical protein N500_0179 [Wolbachia pipientis wUni]ONI57262.1 hypothetical protein N499_1054 [Wolbachia pipientis wVitA]